MRCRDANDVLAAQRDPRSARPVARDYTEEVRAPHSEPTSAPYQSNLHSSPPPPSRMCPAVSTERIMRAVEQQRRITQELEQLQDRQKQKNAVLRITVPVCVALLFFVTGVVLLTLMLLFFFQPETLMRVLGLLSDGIAWLIAVVENFQMAWSFFSPNS